MRLAVPVLASLAAASLVSCLGGGLDDGACNENHVCEPSESYEVCPQDCYWHPDGAEVLGKVLPRAAPDAPLPGMAPRPGEYYERAGNGVCELRESWRFSPDCDADCGDGEDDPDERATCMADSTLARARTECNSNGLCEYQDDPVLAAMLSAAPDAPPHPVPLEAPINCPLDCTPMGPDPALNIFVDTATGNKLCDPHENHFNAPDECAAGCHDGCCATDEINGPCPEDCTVADPIACPCTGDDCLQDCGDGVLDPGELCDDGNTKDTDTCTSICEPARCGDGHVQPGEACDDGNKNDIDGCTNSCTPPTNCGDNFVDPGELCDDGNQDPTDECTSLCKPASCGDGFVHDDVEACDDGPNNADDAACTASCAVAFCGDMLVQTGLETCDDGNDDDTDDCTALCAEAFCGDGIVHAVNEVCDDGNDIDTDGCSNECVPPRRVFIMFPVPGTGGKLGGVLGADFLCNNRAGTAGLPGQYKAWLTDGDADTAPAMRFGSTGFTGWYIANDGTPIAHGWDDLTTVDENQTDYILAAIQINEDGSDIGIDASVWTNTGPDGLQDPANLHCENWTSSSAMVTGAVGLSTPVPEALPLSATWSQYDSEKCNANDFLYCFQTSP